MAHPKYGVDKIQKNNIAGASSAYREGECLIVGFGAEYWGKDTTVEK